MPEFYVPEEIKQKYTWLDECYVRKNGFCVKNISSKKLGEKQKFELHRFWAEVPIKSIEELQIGDIIIFDDYEDSKERFLVVTEEILKSEQKEKLTEAVVVHSPKNKYALQIGGLQILFIEREERIHPEDKIEVMGKTIKYWKKDLKAIQNFFFKNGTSEIRRDKDFRNYKINLKIGAGLGGRCLENDNTTYEGFSAYLI